MSFKIGVLGNEAQYFIDIFTEDNAKILSSYKDITKEYDLVFCTSYPHIIPTKYLEYPKHGVFINHSTDLPQGRGWAPIQWSVLQGLKQITVTLFKAIDDNSSDTGPWVYKSSYTIEPFDTIETLYQKDRLISAQLFQKLINGIKLNRIEFFQQTGKATFYKKRKPEDSELDINSPLADLWDHIRICDNKAYPAFFKINGHKVLLRYEVVKE